MGSWDDTRIDNTCPYHEDVAYDLKHDSNGYQCNASIIAPELDWCNGHIEESPWYVDNTSSEDKCARVLAHEASGPLAAHFYTVDAVKLLDRPLHFKL